MPLTNALDSARSSQEALCGVQSLFVSLRILRKPVAYEVIHAELPATKGGVSIAELERCARAHGVSTRCAKLTLREMSRLHDPLICLIPAYKNDPWLVISNHFIVVYPIQKDRIQIIDPPDGLYERQLAKKKPQEPKYASLILSEKPVTLWWILSPMWIRTVGILGGIGSVVWGVIVIQAKTKHFLPRSKNHEASLKRQ